MPQTTAILDDTRSVTLDANGSGQVTFGPQRPNLQYHIANVAVQGLAPNSTVTAIAQLFVGTVMIAGTYDGNNDSTDVDVTLYTGQTIQVLFTNGQPGDTYSAHFYGSEIRGYGAIQ